MYKGRLIIAANKKTMKKITSTPVSKSNLGFVALALIATVVIFAAPSVSHAQAILPNILVGQDLTVGSSNQGVVVLQGLLSEMGYFNMPAGVSYGYYGALTKTAVANYQASLNVYPAVGYYGPVTKTAIHADFANHGYLSLLGW
ncbi:MAG: hypothetical protein RIT04_29 [Candidatus Parcubacteria bacterium]|jgi:peptidoglycan hydrolase-like protein with peptidoglycan-binding domain